MKVRTQLMLILLSVFLSLTALSGWLKFKITGETRSILQQKLTDIREKDVPKALQQNAAKISGYVYYYSGWDQLANFITQKKDISWAKEKLDNELSSYGLDYIWVVDGEGRQYYSSATNPGLSPLKLNISASDLKKGLEKEKYRSFFIKQNNSLVEVYSGHILPVNDKEEGSKPAGYLLLGRVVDSIYMSGIRNFAPDINFKLTNATGGFKEQIDPAEGSLEFSLPLTGIDGATLASFSISRNYSLLNYYLKYLKDYLLAFLILVIIIGILFYYFANAFLLRPLSSLETALNQRSTEKLSHYYRKKSEFGDLSRLITDFFLQNKKLHEEIEIRKKSEEDLYRALQEKEAAQTEKIKAEEFLGQQQAILKLNSSINDLCFDDIIKETIAHAAKTINCERVGIWLYDDEGLSITANYIYKLSSGDYIEGGRIYEKDYPEYFKHLKKDILIIADDALTHPVFAEFAEDYLAPQKINSIMDVPIRSADRIIGIAGFEHIGAKREWTVNEQVFARSIADIIAITFERIERSKAEAQLNKSQVRFEETQELANIGSWELNFFTKEVIWSKEMYRIFEWEGNAPPTLIDLYRKRINAGDIPVIQKTIKSLAKNHGTNTVESRIIGRNGTVKYILAIGETVKDPYIGDVIGLRGTVQDITKQKQSAMAKSEFLSCMSHEIRTPINGVVGIANLLMEEDLTEKQKEYIKTLNFSAQHLATVVSDILDFSKIESGHMVFERVSFNLEKNCRYLFNLFLNKAAEKGIAFNFIPSPMKDYSLYGDYVRLNQVLSNLLSNAIKFTDKGSVDFSYSIEDDNGDKVKVSFRVKDTGIGIPEENQKQIFESFTQADESITRQYGGTGLGLTISKKLVELQGGSISLKSSRGKGSEFIVELSFDKHVYKKETLPGITTAEKDQNKDLNGMKILVAEDNNINAMVLTRFLTKWNIESKVAQDGSEALEMLEKENFDIILMDIQMPNLDGIEATKLIRQSENEALKNILVVAFTADASVDTHRELLKIGFNHCMTKPFNPETLFLFLKKNYKAA
ncbi:MAG: ATP-binding protein [Bacteroidota bacterium]|nr:ATP-binding protein [Bacteroidota bacterium]